MNMAARRQLRDKRLIWALCIASLVIYINLYMMQGMLPLIAEHFRVTSARATLVLSVTSFTLALSLLLYALVSDRIGRHRPIVLSLWLLAFSNLPLVLIDDFQVLLALRLLQGVLLASLPAIAMAYFKEQLKPQTMLSAAAVYIAANSFGGIIGRLIGGVMSQHFDWQSAMLVCFGFSVVCVAITHYLLPKTRDAVKRERNTRRWSIRHDLADDIGGFVHHLRDSQMRLAYLIGGITFMMMVNQYSFIQLHLLEAFSWSRFQATLIFLCYSSGTVASYFTARWIKRHGQMPLFSLSLLLMLLGSLVTLFDTQVAICLGFLMSSGGFFVTHSCCNSFVAMRATSHRAKATSLYLCVYYLGASAGGPYLMWFWHHAGWQGVIIGSLVLLAAIAICVLRLGMWQRSTANELALVSQR